MACQSIWESAYPRTPASIRADCLAYLASDCSQLAAFQYDTTCDPCAVPLEWPIPCGDVTMSRSTQVVGMDVWNGLSVHVATLEVHSRLGDPENLFFEHLNFNPETNVWGVAIIIRTRQQWAIDRRVPSLRMAEGAWTH